MTVENLLTEEELSSLLGKGAGSAAAEPVQGGERRRRVVPYNFRRPDRVSKEQVRSLYLLHDMFSHSLSSSLPIFLRTISEVTLVSVEQQAYVEYLYGLPDPTAIFTLSMRPLPGVAVLELNPSVAFPVIDRMLGGPGQSLKEARAVTEIEQKILEGFLKVVVDDLREAWRPLIELDLEIVGRETRPQLLQIVAPNEVVITIVFHVQIADARGMMSLCIPAVALEPIISRFNQSLILTQPRRRPRTDPSAAQRTLGGRLRGRGRVDGNDRLDGRPDGARPGRRTPARPPRRRPRRSERGRGRQVLRRAAVARRAQRRSHPRPGGRKLGRRLPALPGPNG